MTTRARRRAVRAVEKIHHPVPRGSLRESLMRAANIGAAVDSLLGR